MPDQNDTQLAQTQAQGLRALADFIEKNPVVAPWFDYSFKYAAVNVHLSGDEASATADFARMAAKAGATVTKEVTDTFFHVFADFGGVKAKSLAYRANVCERVVTGTREVTKTVPDPKALAAVPEVQVTEMVEDVEWVCRPLLADKPEAAVTA